MLYNWHNVILMSSLQVILQPKNNASAINILTIQCVVGISMEKILDFFNKILVYSGFNLDRFTVKDCFHYQSCLTTLQKYICLIKLKLNYSTFIKNKVSMEDNKVLILVMYDVNLSLFIGLLGVLKIIKSRKPGIVNL